MQYIVRLRAGLAPLRHFKCQHSAAAEALRTLQPRRGAAAAADGVGDSSDQVRNGPVMRKLSGLAVYSIRMVLSPS